MAKPIIAVTPELLMKAYNDAEAGMFVEKGIWTTEACACQIDMGFIELKSGKQALVSIRIYTDPDEE